MIQIPAQSVMRVLMAKFKKRTNSSRIALAAGVAVAIAQLMSEMLKDTDDDELKHASYDENDDANVNIFLSAMDTPEFQQQHKIMLDRFYIVHQGRKLYEFEYN